MEVPLAHSIRTKALGAIAGAGTVPQVFINGRLIGGSEALEKFLEGRVSWGRTDGAGGPASPRKDPDARSEPVHTDVAVIGAGTAGLAAYRAAKAAGKRALLIEGGPYGTTCARVGCMPSKLLIAPAEAAHAVDRFAGFGLALEGCVKVDGEAVMARVRSERDRFVGFVTRGVDAIPDVDKVRGRARFVADTHAARRRARYRARDAIVIATGRLLDYPAAWKALGDRLVTNDERVRAADLPESVAVFGPGVIGLELGQALHRLGVRVKVFGRGGGVGPLSDPRDRARHGEIFGNEFYLDTDAHAEVARDGDEVVVRYRGLDGSAQVERFGYLLAATGRTANVRRTGTRADVARDRRQRRSAVRPHHAALWRFVDLHRRRRQQRRAAAARSRRRGPHRRRKRGAFPDVRRGLRRARCSASCSPIHRSRSWVAAMRAREVRRT